VRADEDRWTIAAPPSYERVRRRVFGLAPNGLVAVAALLTLAAAIIGFATAGVAVGVLLVLGALLLAALYLEQARRNRDSSLDRVAAAAADHTKALAGFTGASVRTWTRTGREVAKLRVEAHRLARDRSQLQYALGGAAFEEDEARVAELRSEMRRCVDRIEACTRAAHAAVARAKRQTDAERRAIAATEVRPPKHAVMGDPGFEPDRNAAPGV
jgi:hypothetical protein